MSKDDERLHNLVIMGVWATNDEMEEMVPILGALILVLVVALCIFFACKGCGSDEQKQPEKSPAGQVVLAVGGGPDA